MKMEPKLRVVSIKITETGASVYLEVPKSYGGYYVDISPEEIPLWAARVGKKVTVTFTLEGEEK